MSVLTGYATKIVEGISHNFSSVSGEKAIIFDIAMILIVSAIFAFLARSLKQPLIPAYVIAGFLIGPFVFGLVKHVELIYAFSEIGIAFLLFTAGLEISFKKIKEANLKKITIIGLVQVFAVIGLTILLGSLFSLNVEQSAYLGIIIAFGSTMVVVKLLSDQSELVTLHGRLILGILLLQDLIAIFAIIILTSGGIAFTPILIALLKLIFIVCFAYLLQGYLLGPLFKFAAHSRELLFLSSLAVLFLFILITYLADLSIVIGAFIAGVLLANSPFKVELESRISPLRDFFAIVFFVSLGMQIVFKGIDLGLFIFLLLAAFLIKPLLTIFLLRLNGYTPKTSFQTSVSLAQLSEFSLIIGGMALVEGIFSIGIFSTIILATIISMSLTTYFIGYKERIYQLFKKPMSAFKFLPVKEKLGYNVTDDKKILLVGCHRMGSVLLKELLKKKKQLLVIDYNPEIIQALMKNKISCIYGEVSSPDILEKINLKNMDLIVSTTPNHEENLYLLKISRKTNPDAKIIINATRISEAIELYEKGADYVILPKVLAGEQIKEILSDGSRKLKNMREEHIKNLEKIHRVLY